MLKSWSLHNFKPIRDLDELKLAPVTVLAGRNSSGKSSLIQSILMIAQTLSSRVLDRPLLPHGSFVHLGTFEDVLNKYSTIQSLTVGFQLEMGKEELIASERRGYVVGNPFYRFGTQLSINSVKVTSQFIGAATNGSASSAIEASKVSLEKVLLEVSLSFNDDPFEFSIDINKLTDEELGTFLKNVAPEYLRLIPYSIKESNYLGIFKTGDQRISNSIADDSSLVAFSHFLPTRLISKFKTEERLRQQLTRAVDRIFHSSTASLNLYGEIIDPDAPLPARLRQDILKLYESEISFISKNFGVQSLRDLARWHNRLKLGRGRKKSALGSKIKNMIIQRLMEQNEQSRESGEKASNALEVMPNNTYIENLEKSVEQINRFFTSKIRYLGPLRAYPEEISQGFSPSSELDDVGSKGQYAATVYDANQNAPIQWYNPISQEIEEGTLKTALNAWARHLGVAHEIQIEIAGQSGVSWQVVHLEGHRPLPLTAVGVGVSQILPILVMGLLSSSGTLLLVEQPELHLHPNVQARLGDFFMGLAKCGKQCLIETHSENLVSQLRYHIVQAGGMEKSDCLIYFVDQDELGSAKFEPVEISPQGNILNWPEGFFDETILQEGRIATEGMRKKAKQASNG